MTESQLIACITIFTSLFTILLLTIIQYLNHKIDALDKENKSLKRKLEANRMTRKSILINKIRHNGRD